MSSFPAATTIANIANQGSGKVIFEEWLAANKQLPGALPWASLTIASDQVTPTQFAHKIDTQGGASVDDLKQILQTNLPDGSQLLISIVSASRAVRVFNAAGGTGQIILKTGDNFWLGDPSHYLLLIRSGNTWEEIDRSPKADLAPMITKNANYTMSAVYDRGRSIYSTGNDWTLSLPQVTAAGKGFDSFISNPHTSGIVTVTANGGDLVDGKSTIKLFPGESIHIVSDGSASWITLDRTKSRPQRGYLFGLTLSNSGTDATNDILIGPGECASDDSDPEARLLMGLTSTYTKQLDQVWAAGSATVGGRISSESLVDGTWHVFQFRRSNGLIDYCFSQLLNPTVPDSGTHKRRVASFLRESGAIVAFHQDGDYFTRKTSILDLNLTNPGSSATPRTLSVPNGIEVFAFGTAVLTSPTVDSMVWFSDLAVNAQTPGFNVAPLGNVIATAAKSAVFSWNTRTNTSRQIRTHVDASNGGTVLKISTTGWIDPRDRNR